MNYIVHFLQMNDQFCSLDLPLGEGPLIQLVELDWRPSHQPLVTQHQVPDMVVVLQYAVPACPPAPVHPGAGWVEVAQLGAYCLHQATSTGPGGRSRGLSDQAAAKITMTMMSVIEMTSQD